MKIVRTLAGLVVLGAAFGGGYWFATTRGGGEDAQTGRGSRKILYWHDPMHPSYKSDKPGIAPDCGMRLEPVYADEAGGGGSQKPQGKVGYYYDPEQPQYRSDKAGINPETGNDLVPMYESPAPGTITVSPERQQLIGVTYAVASPVQADQTIRAVGRVAYDETRVSRVNARVEGWVDHVMVNETGQHVRAGQPLLTLYSPELLASQQEYLLALRSRNVLAGSTVPGVAAQTSSLIEASRQRLSLFDLSEAQIEEITRTGQPIRTVTLHSPASGMLIERKVYPKMKISSEMELFTLADLSRVWVHADVYEYEAADIRIGMPATIHVPALGDARLQARVTQLLPSVDPQTRTLQVRLEVPNPGLRLRPDMFVEVNFYLKRSAAVAVPAGAVLDTGLRKTVYVALDGGVIEPRRVETGQTFGQSVEITKGINPGERVVASGNFLIDSESQMRAAAEGPPMPSVPEAKKPGPGEPLPHTDEPGVAPAPGSGGGHRH
jgi:RND family efflux transporter MFP subunit